jgi:hypothetical protein
LGLPASWAPTLPHIRGSAIGRPLDKEEGDDEISVHREETMKTLCVGLVLVLVMTFATPLLSLADDQYPLYLSITTNGDSLVEGSKLTVSVSIQNPGLPAVVDFYFGVVLPDGDTTVFFTDPFSFASGVGSLANPATLQPIVAGVDLRRPFTFSQPTFFSLSYPGDGPDGWYYLFISAVKSGALVDNVIEASDVLGLSWVFVFIPPSGPCYGCWDAP